MPTTYSDKMILKHYHAIPVDKDARNTVLLKADPQTAHMFIINPFTGKEFSMGDLFRTHPSTEARIERLEALKQIW